MKKIAAVLLSLFVLSGTVFAHTMEFIFPLKIEIAKTEKELNYNYCGTDALGFPLPIVGPIRVNYLFENNDSKWTFGAGASVYVYPFQSINASALAIYEICSFKNGSALEVRNVFDVGLFMHFKEYYNVSKGRRDIMTSVSPLLEYSCMIYYRTGGNVPFLVGIGPVISGACDEQTIKIYYGINVDLGFRIKF